MKIAFLGWGSLIWDPRELRMSGIWQKDGPLLPIEFAHVSDNRRLTLVLDPKGATTQTLWALSSCTALSEAIESLRKREKTRKENIGRLVVSSNKRHCGTVPAALEKIREWALSKEIDAVVWTDLKANFEDKTEMVFNGDNVVKYLKELETNIRCMAEEYVRKAPGQTRTPIRTKIENDLGWHPRSTNPLRIVEKKKVWPVNREDEMLMKKSHGRTEILLYQMETNCEKTFWYQVPQSGDVVAVVAYEKVHADDDDRIVYLVRQARPAWTEKTSGVLILPGGGVPSDLGHKALVHEAKRELKEETGYDCRVVKKLATLLCSARIRSKHHIYMAEIESKGEAEPEEIERMMDTHVEALSLREAIEKLRNGKEETTGYTFLGLLLASEKLKR